MGLRLSGFLGQIGSEIKLKESVHIMESLLRPRRGFQSSVSQPRSWRAVSCSETWKLAGYRDANVLLCCPELPDFEFSSGPLLAE
jgi:hypothetical protein